MTINEIYKIYYTKTTASFHCCFLFSTGRKTRPYEINLLINKNRDGRPVPYGINQSIGRYVKKSGRKTRPPTNNYFDRNLQLS